MPRAVLPHAVRLLLVLCCTTGLPQMVRAAPQEVTYLLPASPTTPAFAPWMIALQQGYYADENLKVTFITGRGGVDVAKQIGAGNAPIGGAIGDTPIIVRANGVPVKSVAVLGAGSLTTLAVRADSPIKSVKDLKGKTVTVLAYTDTTYYALQGSLRKALLSRNDVNVQAVGPTAMWQLFAAGKADAMAGVPERLVSVEESGVKIRLLPESEVFKSMAQAILASDEIIEKDPELIRRLVRATLRGMNDIMKDPKAAARVYAQAVPTYKGREESIEKVFALYNRYVYSGQKVLGTIDTDRLAQVQKFYVSEGIVPSARPLSELYTNRFVGVER